MIRFYLLLWRRWVIRFVLYSVVLAGLLSAFVSAYIYIKQGAVELNSQVYSAIWDVFMFWFAVLFAFSILVALFVSLRYIFGICFDGFKIDLLECDRANVIQKIKYGDLIRVWRKFFMLLIWIVAFEMMIFYIWTNPFNIYALFGFVVFGSFFVIILLISRCKKIKLSRCKGEL